jgi:hypothetical protein
MLRRIAHSRQLPPVHDGIPSDWNPGKFSTLSDDSHIPLLNLDQLLQYHLNADQIRKIPDSMRIEYEHRKLEIETLRKNIAVFYKNSFKQEAAAIIDELQNIIIGELMRNFQDIILYGTGSYNKFGKNTQKFDSVFTFKEPIVTSDIDVISIDPDKVSKRIHQALLRYIVGYDFTFDGNIIFTIDRLELAKMDHKNCITVIIKCNSYYVCRRNIFDCVQSNSHHFGNIICSGIRLQSPQAYICGMIDKLYNSKFNSRMANNIKKEAKLEMLRRFQLLEIHNPDGIIEESLNFPMFMYLLASPGPQTFLKLLLTQGPIAAINYYNAP